METIFKVGMKVYDQVFFGDETLEIIEVRGDMSLRVLYGEATYCYTGDGRFIGDDIISNRWNCISQIPTLSTSPYTLQGFEQKVPAKTYEEAVEWLEKNSKDRVIYADEAYINEGYELAFEALKKLVILRDYYNGGWQPNWNIGSTKYCIEQEGLDVSAINHIYNSRVMCFETDEIRNKFLEEQKELLEIAKPLL
jgi:hypothetical protein